MTTIALVGTSGSGKTTLMNKLNESLRRTTGTVCLEEVTKGEILTRANLPVRELKDFTRNQLPKYDLSRLELAMEREEDVIKRNKAPYVIIDKPALVLMMYFLMYDSRFVSDESLEDMVNGVIEHSKMYDFIFHLPANTFDTKKDSLNRNVTNKSVLKLQDAMLLEILSWVETSYASLRKDDRVETIMMALSLGRL